MKGHAFLVTLCGLAIAVIVVGGHGGIWFSGNPLPLPLAVDRIAYVDHDGRIWTVEPDGSDHTAVSPKEGFHTWPTWSPDGHKLAFSGISDRGTSGERILLYTYNLLGRRLHRLHIDTPDAADPVTSGAPYYVMWSPDGRRLAVIDSDSRGQTLYVDDLRDGAGAGRVLEGLPLFMAWSPDSDQLLVHRGVDHLLVDVGAVVTTSLAIPADDLGYQAPSWSPSGDAITFVSSDGPEGHGLYVSDVDVLNRYLMANVPRNSAFLWSPQGDYLAVTDADRVQVYAPFGVRVFRRVSLFQRDGTRYPAGIEDNVVAFFWSPDGTRLAYVALGNTPGVLRWMALDVTDGTRRHLLDFVPSSDQMSVFQYFEQYAKSHSLWSPDSRSIVSAGRVAGQDLPASLGQQASSEVFVINAGVIPWARTIANGTLGFWSPR